MEPKHMLESLRPQEEVIATFGHAQLRRKFDGKVELQGGTAEDRQKARDWISMLWHEGQQSGQIRHRKPPRPHLPWPRNGQCSGNNRVALAWDGSPAAAKRATTSLCVAGTSRWAGRRWNRAAARSHDASGPKMNTEQTELFTGDLTAHEAAPSLGATAKLFRPQHTLQDYLPRESLLAVQLAVDAADMDDLRQRLNATLPQNSAITRRRYVESITRWFLRDGCRGFAPTVWARFHDEDLQLALHRYLFLSTQPIIAACVITVFSRLADGIIVPPGYLGASMAKLGGHELNPKTRKRLVANLRKLGFLELCQAGDRVVSPPFPKSALLLALHHAFSVDAPHTIEFATLTSNPFWRFIGLRSEDALRDFLKESEHAGLLGKYIVADRLEQITTCYSLAALIEKGVEL